MDSKIRIIAGFFLVCFLQFTGCKECDDGYGDRFHMIVPFDSYTVGDTITTSDTIRFATSFSKDIELDGQSSTYRLDEFNFHSELIIADLSDTMSSYNYSFQIFEEVGDIDTLVLGNTIGWPLHYVEDDDSYSFAGAIIIEDPGIYYLSWSSNRRVLNDHYSHPALFKCEDEKRYDNRVFYSNKSSTIENYENYFLKTKDEVFLKRTFEEYQEVGGYTFVVVE